MPVIFYPPSDKFFKVSFLSNTHFIKHKSLLWHHTANSSHTLHNILLKWEVTLSGISIHCPPLCSHVFTWNSTQHYWYLSEYFSSFSFPTLKIYTILGNRLGMHTSHLPAPSPGQRADAEVALALPRYQRFMVLLNSAFWRARRNHWTTSHRTTHTGYSGDLDANILTITTLECS